MLRHQPSLICYEEPTDVTGVRHCEPTSHDAAPKGGCAWHATTILRAPRYPSPPNTRSGRLDSHSLGLDVSGLENGPAFFSILLHVAMIGFRYPAWQYGQNATSNSRGRRKGGSTYLLQCTCPFVAHYPGRLQPPRRKLSGGNLPIPRKPASLSAVGGRPSVTINAA